MSSVPLPNKRDQKAGVVENDGAAKGPPIWAISGTTSNAGVGVSTPLRSKCARHQNGRRGICCKELKKEERHLIDPDVMRDV